MDAFFTPQTLDGTLHTQVYAFTYTSILLGLILFRIFQQKDTFYKFIELCMILD